MSTARNAFDVLMLPKAPHTGSNNSPTALDCLLADLIENLRTDGLGFPPSIKKKKKKKKQY
jgi:hypothetical protein